MKDLTRMAFAIMVRGSLAIAIIKKSLISYKAFVNIMTFVQKEFSADTSLLQDVSQQFTDEAISFYTYLSLLTSLSRTEKVRLMQDRDEFIRSCSFDGYDCKK